jgi:hypothetical protein
VATLATEVVKEPSVEGEGGGGQFERERDCLAHGDSSFMMMGSKEEEGGVWSSEMARSLILAGARIFM